MRCQRKNTTLAIVPIILAFFVVHCKPNKKIEMKGSAAVGCVDDLSQRIEEGMTSRKNGETKRCFNGKWVSMDAVEQPCYDDSSNAVESGVVGTRNNIKQRCFNGSWAPVVDAQTACHNDSGNVVASGMTRTKNGVIQRCLNGSWVPASTAEVICIDDFGNRTTSGGISTKDGVNKICRNGSWHQPTVSQPPKVKIPPIEIPTIKIPKVDAADCNSIIRVACRNACKTRNPQAIADANRDLGCKIPRGATTYKPPVISRPKPGASSCDSITRIECRNACKTRNRRAIADANRDLGCKIP